MSSVVEICNMAIGYVSGNRIDDINAYDQMEAILCRERYNTCRRSVLEDAEWAFATKRVTLAPDLTPPDFGYSHRFQLPADCLLVREVSSDSFLPHQADWVREGMYVLTNHGTIYVRYTADIEDPLRYTGGFTRAFALLLASELALPITHSAKLQERYQEAYEKELFQAANKDAQQDNRKSYATNSLLQVR